MRNKSTFFIKDGIDLAPRRNTSSRGRENTSGPPGGKVRYAVVGLGHVAQAAVLPAFAHARSNSQLVAAVSGDPMKHRKVGGKYRIPTCYSYREYEQCLRSGEVDAVYIALPNSLHREFAVRAAHAGVHVLCEKPLALTEDECEA